MADVRRAAVIGTGTMGPGMGAVLARAGIETALYDVSAEALERAKAGVELAGRRARAARRGAGGRRRGPLRERSRGRARGRRLRARGRAGEARAEAASCSRSSRQTSPTTRSSPRTPPGIPITKIASVCAHPERVVGMHWSNPPHLIPMIEVIPGEQTSQETVDATSRARAPHRLPPRRREGGGRLRREPDPLRDPPRVPRPRRPRDHRPRGARPERALGDRLQARRHRPDGAPGHGRPRHLQRRRLVPEPGPLHLGRGLVDDPRT